MSHHTLSTFQNETHDNKDSKNSRVPKCARCRNHGVSYELKGHKEKCRYRDCVCRSCLVVVERQRITASRVAQLRHQRKISDKNGSQHYDYKNSLTEEEDFVLSSNMRVITDDTEYPTERPYQNEEMDSESYDASKINGYCNGRFLRSPTTSPPLFSSHTHMLFEEAHSAYSNFYVNKHRRLHRRYSHPSPYIHPSSPPRISNKINNSVPISKSYAKTLTSSKVIKERNDKQRAVDIFKQTSPTSKTKFSYRRSFSFSPEAIDSVLYKDYSDRYYSRTHQVLFVMFPEIDEKVINAVLKSCDFVMHLAVDQLLRSKYVSQKDFENHAMLNSRSICLCNRCES